ncbi:hypothetical protein SAMN03084138_02280 [Enterovibrio norvegicus DSM 15893]|uniref:Uncharacterized protein n=1 Tax=Enterovibrio norvegicus DSM 15893 TaxID=1121869 RepID=A0A1I5QLD6_9GAMM|nr:hypothetical protein SAMN03084138_02280 [Enterovibrio norvegicus DSM 15893]
MLPNSQIVIISTKDRRPESVFGVQPGVENARATKTKRPAGVPM